MTKEELEAAIREIIKRLYCHVYCAHLEVNIHEDCGAPNTYELRLGFTSYAKPLGMSFLGTAEGFLKFITQELKLRLFPIAKYYTGYKNDYPHLTEETCPRE